MSAVRDSKTAPTHGDPPASASRVGERIQSYILDGRDEDLRRLVRISQVTARPPVPVWAGRVSSKDGA